MKEANNVNSQLPDSQQHDAEPNVDGDDRIPARDPLTYRFPPRPFLSGAGIALLRSQFTALEVTA
jgi:hypothetical protein